MLLPQPREVGLGTAGFASHCSLTARPSDGEPPGIATGEKVRVSAVGKPPFPLARNTSGRGEEREPQVAAVLLRSGASGAGGPRGPAKF